MATLRKNVVAIWVPTPAETKAAESKAAKGKKGPAAKPKIEKIEQLAGHKVGVIGRTQSNVNLLRLILQQYGIAPDRVEIVQFAVTEVNEAIRSNKADAFFAVGPANSQITTDAIAATVRDGGTATFLPIDLANSIETKYPIYDATEIAPGAFGGSPARPDESVKTISFGTHIVARKSISDQTVATFTRQLFSMRQALIADNPQAARMEVPDTDKDAAIPVHPGTEAYVDGEEKSFMDRYSDLIWWSILCMSLLGSAGAWAAGYLKKDERTNNTSRRERLLEMLSQARRASSHDELDEMQAEADDILRDTQLLRARRDRVRHAVGLPDCAGAVPQRCRRPPPVSCDRARPAGSDQADPVRGRLNADASAPCIHFHRHAPVTEAIYLRRRAAVSWNGSNHPEATMTEAQSHHFTAAFPANLGTCRHNLRRRRRVHAVHQPRRRAAAWSRMACSRATSTADSGMIWARADRPAQHAVRVSTTESFKNAMRAAADRGAARDRFHRQAAAREPAVRTRTIFYRVTSATSPTSTSSSEPVAGRFRTAPADRRDVRFVWSRRHRRPGLGHQPRRRRHDDLSRHAPAQPDFFIHSGDTIYADGPIKAEVTLPDGTHLEEHRRPPEKAKVAETLAEFRGQLQLQPARREPARASTPRCRSSSSGTTTRSPTTGRPRRTCPRRPLHGEATSRCWRRAPRRRSTRCMPIRARAAEPGRVYRKISYGPLLDVFMLDMRTYRGPNGDNLQTDATARIAHSSAPSSSPG